MWRGDDLRMPDHRIVRIGRLLRENIQTRSGDRPAVQRLDKIMSVHDLPARRVDKKCRRLHTLERITREQAASLAGQRDMNRNEVAPGQQPVERNLRYAV